MDVAFIHLHSVICISQWHHPITSQIMQPGHPHIHSMSRYKFIQHQKQRTTSRMGSAEMGGGAQGTGNGGRGTGDGYKPLSASLPNPDPDREFETCLARCKNINATINAAAGEGTSASRVANCLHPTSTNPSHPPRVLDYYTLPVISSSLGSLCAINRTPKAGTMMVGTTFKLPRVCSSRHLSLQRGWSKARKGKVPRIRLLEITRKVR